MASKQGAGWLGVVAVVTRQGNTLRLTVRSVRTRRRVAVVEGSEEFLRKALSALGLGAAPAVPGLAKNRHGSGLPLVGRKPAHRNL